MRADTTVVETDIHHPTDSSLLGDGVRVLVRTMKKVQELTGKVGTAAVDRGRSCRRRLVEIARVSRGRAKDRQERLEAGYVKLMGIARDVVRRAERFVQAVFDPVFNTLMDLSYNFQSPSNGGSNGNIYGISDLLTGQSRTFSYDRLNRLTGAAGGSWSVSYSYDRFGNRLSATGSAGTPNFQSSALTVDSSRTARTASRSSASSTIRSSSPSCATGVRFLCRGAAWMPASPSS
ncbi:MAG: hypothetical protein V3T83_03665 [Acidobacteriota bacterium]